jgi:hypothetical protein
MRAIPLFACAATAVLVATSSSPASRTHFESNFHTPGQLAYCYLRGPFEYERAFPPYLTCWTPKNGYTATMTARGRPTRSTQTTKYPKGYRGYRPFAIRALRFGQRWWGVTWGREGVGRGGSKVNFRCTSHSTGLTCKNRAGHGFWLGRPSGYRSW